MKRFLPTVLALLAVPSAAFAHAVGVEAKLKDGVVRVEAYYDDDTPAAAAKVTVEGEAKAVVAEGKTDAKGVWSFPAPPAGRYTIRVDAGAGHVAKTTITVPPAHLHASGTEPGTAPADAEPVSISEGPTRASFTGPTRWVMAAVGVGLIGALAAAARWVIRRRSGAAGVRNSESV